MKKKAILVPFVTMSVVVLVACSGCLQSGTGTLVLKITDAPSDLNITHANVTISQVQVHMSAGAGNNTTAGWYTVVNESQTFDLIAIQDVFEFFGSANLSAGMYTQIRLTIDECIITVNGTEYACTVPSGAIKLIRPFVLKANQNTTLILDFDAQESILEKGNGQYSFKPVIRVLQE
ncbi:MAG: DUF4382 domain-containing protein [Candidatus Thermoplasmatota archaeon]|nr:DUF4382 domain-containing protein [Candidatus Thermoplasmatota archaeon]